MAALFVRRFSHVQVCVYGCLTRVRRSPALRSQNSRVQRHPAAPCTAERFYAGMRHAAVKIGATLYAEGRRW
jgi:hypothetical protein